MNINGFVVRRSNGPGKKEVFDSKDAMLKFNRRMQEGSVAHCRAIIETGTLYGPMTMKQQTQSIEYAYGVGVVYVD